MDQRSTASAPVPRREGEETRLKPATKAEEPAPEADFGKSVPLAKLPASFRKMLRGTPEKEWYRLRAVRVRHEDSVELVGTLAVVDHVLEVAPPKLIKLLREGKVTPAQIDAGFRRIRDAGNSLKDACRHVAGLAGLEIRAWKEEETPPEAGEPAAGRTPE